MNSIRIGILTVVVLYAGSGEAGAQTSYTWNDTTTDWTQSSAWGPAGPDWMTQTRLTDSIAAFGPRASISNQPNIGDNLLYVRQVTIDNTGGAVWSLAGTSLGNLSLGSGGLTVTGSAASTITANLSVTTDQTWSIASTNLTMSGVLSGSGSLTKSGVGTLILDNGGNTFFGGIAVSEGTLSGAATANVAFRSNHIDLASGTTFSGTAPTRMGELNGAGTLTLGTNEIKLQILSNATSSATITTGNVELRSGVGRQTFSGNTSALLGDVEVGGVNLRDGTTSSSLVLSGANTTIANASASSNQLILRGGTAVLDNSTSNVSRFANNARSNNRVSFQGGGRLEVIGNATSDTTINAGTLRLRGGSHVVEVEHSGSSGGTVLDFNFGATNASLRGDTTMVVNFVGTGGTLGSAGSNPRIMFSGGGVPFTGTGGMLANGAGAGTTGWALVNGTDWAGLSGNAIVALANTNRTNADFNSAGTTELVNLTSSASLSAARTIGALKISPGGTGQSLALGAFNLNVNGVLLPGTTDYTITGSTGALFGTSTGTKYLHVITAGTTLSISANMAGGANPITKGGDGIVALTGASNQLAFSSSENINLTAGTFRVRSASIGGFNSNQGANAAFRLRGGILELDGGGTFTRFLGAGAVGGGGVRWGLNTDDAGSGGFSAINGDATVRLVTAVGGSTSVNLVWDTTTDFIASSYALMFGSSTATHSLTFSNSIALDASAGNYSARQIHVFDNTSSSNDKAVLSGVISGSANVDFLKTGAGVLELTNTNTYRGNTLVSQGTLIVSGSLGTPFGPEKAGSVLVSSGAKLGGVGNIYQDVNSANTVRIKGDGTITAGTGTSTPELTLAVGTGGLVLDNSANYEVKLFGPGATQVSHLDVSGNVSINSGANLKLDLSALTVLDVETLRSGSPVTYTVITGTGTVGNFTSLTVTDAGNFGSGSEWSLVGIPDPGTVQIRFAPVPVPEPAAVLGIAVAAMGVGGFVRRRFRKDVESTTAA